MIVSSEFALIGNQARGWATQPKQQSQMWFLLNDDGTKSAIVRMPAFDQVPYLAAPYSCRDWEAHAPHVRRDRTASWRRGRDSNPRDLAAQRFSRPPR